MSILGLILSIAVFGAIVYLIMLLPMPPLMKQILNVVLGILLLLYVLQLFGVHTGFPSVHLR